jgi:peptidoglycan/LPS O-acetylase OafA/YrhL
VWTFFALSGFLITGILARSREEVEAGRISSGGALERFYLRRTARIFPVYYAMLGVALVISLFVSVNYFWGQEKIAYLLYATNVLIARDGWVGDFSHLWSLAIEEQYYILFAPMVLWLPRRWTPHVCIAILAAGVVTSLAMHAAQTPRLAIYVNSLVNFAMLGYGGLIGLVAQRATPPAWLTSGAAQVAVAAALIGAPVAFGAPMERWMAYGPVVLLLAGLLLFQIFKGQRTAFVALLESAPFRLVGRVSYAAYLFHPFIHFATLQRLLAAGGVRLQVGRPLEIVAEFAVTLALCALSWRGLESPFIKLGSRLSTRIHQAPAREIPDPGAIQVAAAQGAPPGSA